MDGRRGFSGFGLKLLEKDEPRRIPPFDETI
jgi:hypothetical protein